MLTTKLLFSFVYLCYAVNEILAIICGQPTRTASSFSSEGRTNIFYMRLTNSRKSIATRHIYRKNRSWRLIPILRLSAEWRTVSYVTLKCRDFAIEQRPFLALFWMALRALHWRNRVSSMRRKKETIKSGTEKKEGIKVCVATIFSEEEETLKRWQSLPNYCPLSHGNTSIPVAVRSIEFFNRFKESSSPIFTLHYLLIVSPSACCL